MTTFLPLPCPVRSQRCARVAASVRSTRFRSGGNAVSDVANAVSDVANAFADVGNAVPDVANGAVRNHDSCPFICMRHAESEFPRSYIACACTRDFKLWYGWLSESVLMRHRPEATPLIVAQACHVLLPVRGVGRVLGHVRWRCL
jgi:hypothetical protein